jgi:hypothetical protein
MTEILHGLVSGLFWSTILVPSMVALVAVSVSMVPATPRVPGESDESIAEWSDRQSRGRYP